MKMSITALLLALLLTDNVTAQKKTDIEHDRLIGSVKSMRIETAKLVTKSGIWVEKARSLQRVINYDPQGNMTKETIYIDRPTITLIRYRYDADGNRTEEILIEGPPGPAYGSYGTDRGGSLGSGDGRSMRLVRRVFKHDSDGNRIEEVIYSNSYRRPIQSGRAMTGIYRHTYDSKGRRKETVYSAAGSLIRRWVYVLDENGNVGEMAVYSEGGHLLSRESYRYEYDGAGNWIKRTTSTWKKRGSHSYFEPEEVTYRTIE
jgi:YD repeat-containing protein